MTRCFVILSLFCSVAVHAQTTSATAPPAAAAVKWPVQEGQFDIPNFHFRDGEVLQMLHLRYLTLGTPHRDKRGHTDNAILLLHGTGGDAKTLLAPIFSTVL